jgi:hypothetical protein
MLIINIAIVDKCGVVVIIVDNHNRHYDIRVAIAASYSRQLQPHHNRKCHRDLRFIAAVLHQQ